MTSEDQAERPRPGPRSKRVSIFPTNRPTTIVPVHRSHTTRSHDQTCGEDWIVHEVLQIRPAAARAKPESDSRRPRSKIAPAVEIAIAKQHQPHEEAGYEGVNQKKIEGRASNSASMTISLNRTQLLISPRCQKNLQRTMAGLRVPKPNRSKFLAVHSAGSPAETSSCRKRQGTLSGPFDIEHITPSVILREPAAKHRAERRDRATTPMPNSAIAKPWRGGPGIPALRCGDEHWRLRGPNRATASLAATARLRADDRHSTIGRWLALASY